MNGIESNLLVYLSLFFFLPFQVKPASRRPSQRPGGITRSDGSGRQGIFMKLLQDDMTLFEFSLGFDEVITTTILQKVIDPNIG
jgi:hypothetical protein